MGGFSIQVNAGTGGNNPVTSVQPGSEHGFGVAIVRASHCPGVGIAGSAGRAGWTHRHRRWRWLRLVTGHGFGGDDRSGSAILVGLFCDIRHTVRAARELQRQPAGECRNIQHTSADGSHGESNPCDLHSQYCSIEFGCFRVPDRKRPGAGKQRSEPELGDWAAAWRCPTQHRRGSSMHRCPRVRRFSSLSSRYCRMAASFQKAFLIPTASPLVA